MEANTSPLRGKSPLYPKEPSLDALSVNPSEESMLGLARGKHQGTRASIPLPIRPTTEF